MKPRTIIIQLETETDATVADIRKATTAVLAPSSNKPIELTLTEKPKVNVIRATKGKKAKKR